MNLFIILIRNSIDVILILFSHPLACLSEQFFFGE